MIYNVTHTTKYAYTEPVSLCHNLVHLRPRVVPRQLCHFSHLEVQPDEGPERVVAVPLTLEQNGRTGTLVGLLGEVDAGWKLFPLHAIKVMTLDAKK